MGFLFTTSVNWWGYNWCILYCGIKPEKLLSLCSPQGGCLAIFHFLYFSIYFLDLGMKSGHGMFLCFSLRKHVILKIFLFRRCTMFVKSKGKARKKNEWFHHQQIFIIYFKIKAKKRFQRNGWINVSIHRRQRKYQQKARQTFIFSTTTQHISLWNL